MAELDPSGAGGVQRVFVHVGAPKTGTTFLQKRLLGLRKQLRDEHGVLFPADAYDSHFFAAADLQDGTFHGASVPESRGRWAPVAQAVREWPGTSVISHEILAAATVEHARRAVADLAPAEVHVIYTVRDLGRQLTSRWQEDVKHGLQERFEDWWRAVQRHDERHVHARWFWRTDDPVDVLDRWGEAVGPDRFHLVTVPRGGGPDELWARFAGLVGFDPSLTRADAEANSGLGVAEVELLRRVNIALRGTFSAQSYGRAVKGVLAHETLRRRPGMRRISMPAAVLPEVERLAEEWTSVLQARGVHVVGDLDELMPHLSSGGGEPSSVTADEVVDSAMWTIGELLKEVDRNREELRVLRRLIGLPPIRAAVRARLSAGRAVRAIDQRTGLGLWKTLRRGSPPV
jgi:hypothetical protein